MPRRWLDPAFFNDEKLAKATIEERLLFAAVIANQDDDGRLLGHPGYLRSIAFPYDDFTIEQVKQMRDHLAEINSNFILYTNDGNEYIQLKRHNRYQRPRYYHPSKYPAPPGWPFKDEEERVPLEDSNHAVTIQQPHGDREVTMQYTEDRGGEGLGKGLDLDKGDTPKGARKKRASPQADPRIKVVFDEIKNYFGHPEKTGGRDPIPNYGMEGQAIKRMFTRGFTREEILACWRSKVSQRGGEYVSMKWVNQDILAFARGGEPLPGRINQGGEFKSGRRERENKGQRVAGARPASDFSRGKW